MSLSIKKKAIKKAISVMTMVMTVTVMSNVGFLNTSLVMADVVDGALIKSNTTNSDGSPTLSSLDVYIVKLVGTKKFKRLVLNPTVFNSYGHLNWGDIQTVSQSVMDEYATSGLVRVDTDPDEKVYAMAPDGDIGSKSWVNVTAAEFLGVSGSEDGDSIYTINATDGGNYTAVGNITTTTQLETFYSAGTLPDAPVVSGDLSVALSSNTPAVGNVPMHAQGVEFLKFNVSAGESDVTLNTITFTRTGMGSKDDFTRVWAEKDGITVANGKTVNASQEVALNFSGYEISAGETVELSLVVDLADNRSGNIDAFKIASTDAIGSSADSVSGSFPIQGNEMSITSYNIADVVYAAAGSATTIDSGSENVVVGEFSLAVTSNNSNDATFRSIRLKESGTGKLLNLDNLVLYDDAGDLITDEYTIDSNGYLNFVIDGGYAIENGDTGRFKVKADVVSGDDGNTIILQLAQNYHLLITEDGVGFGAAVTGAAVMNTYTINAGSFAIALDSSSPSNAEYAPETSQATGIIAKMTLDEDVQVDGLKVYLHTDTDISNAAEATDQARINADIDDVRLYVGGTYIDTQDTVVYDSTATGASDTDNTLVADEYYYDFASSFTVNNGDLIEVAFDVKTGADASNVYKFQIAATNFTSPEYIESGESVATADKTGTAYGKKATIVAATVSGTVNDGYSNGEIFIAGKEGAKLMQVVLEAGNSSSIMVKTLDFDFTALTSGEQSKYTNAMLKIGDTQIGSSTDMTGSGTTGNLSFTSINEEIAAGTTITVALYVDLETTITATTNALAPVLDVSDSLFYDKENNTVTSYGSDVTGATLNINSNGSLTVAVDSKPSAVLLAADTTDNSVGKFTFTAEDDSIDITDLYFTNDFVPANASSTDADARMSALKLYVDGVQVGADKVMTSGTVHFNLGSTNAITVDKNGIKTVEVKVNLNSISSESNSGKRLELVLYSISAEGTGGSLTTVSGLADAQLDGGVYATATHALSQAANEMAIVKSSPVVIVNTGEAATTLANVTKKMFAFDVTANDAGPISFNEVIVTVAGTHNSSAIGAASHTVTNILTLGSVAVKREGVAETVTATEATVTTMLIAFSAVQTITAGDTETFVVEAPLTGFDVSSTSSDSLETYINNPTTTYVAPLANTSVVSTASFVWTDNSGTYQSLTDAQWFTDYLVNGLDTGRVTLVK